MELCDFEVLDIVALSALVEGRAIETASLEFKEAIDLANEQGKDELATDVASFANSVGGDILVGVSERADGEKKGYATACDGIVVDNADALMLRIQSILQERIEPRLVGVRMKVVQIDQERHVLAIRIPRSWQLHAVRRNKAYAVYARNANGKYPLDFFQIRDAFTLGAAATERAMIWRSERIARLAAGETPRILSEGPKLVLHVIPVAAFAGERSRLSVDLEALETTARTMKSSGSNRTYNADGLLIYAEWSNNCEEYSQVYRDGRLESLSAVLTVTSAMGSRPYFHAVVGDIVIRAVAAHRDLLPADPGPTLISLSILGGKGTPISNESKWSSFGKSPIDRDIAMLPEIQLDSLSKENQLLAKGLRPGLDSLYQAGGHSRCPSFGADGTYIEVN